MDTKNSLMSLLKKVFGLAKIYDEEVLPYLHYGFRK